MLLGPKIVIFCAFFCTFNSSNSKKFGPNKLNVSSKMKINVLFNISKSQSDYFISEAVVLLQRKNLNKFWTPSLITVFLFFFAITLKVTMVILWNLTQMSPCKCSTYGRKLKLPEEPLFQFSGDFYPQIQLNHHQNSSNFQWR